MGLELTMPGGVRLLLPDDSQTILGTLITPSEVVRGPASPSYFLSLWHGTLRFFEGIKIPLYCSWSPYETETPAPHSIF